MLIDDLGINHEVDLKDSQEIAMSFCVNDILKLAQPEYNFAKSVSLLGTDKTNNALGYLFRVDKVDRSMLHKRLKARLTMGSIDIMQGAGVLEVVDMIFNPETNTMEYDCDLTAQGYDWKVALKALRFCDAGLGSHTFDATTSNNTWDRTGKNGTPYPYDYIGATYFPVHYGWWLGDTDVTIYDLRPHAYIKYLLEKAFDTIGYTLQGEYTQTEEFAKRVMIFGNGIFGAAKSDIDNLYRVFDIVPDTYYGSGEVSTYLVAGPAVDGIWQSTTWTQPFDYSMRVVVSFPDGSIDLTSSAQFQIGIYLDDVQVAVTTIPPSAPYDFTVVYEGCVGKGQRIRVKMIDGLLPIYPNYMFLLEGAQITVTPLNACIGSTIDLCDTIDPALDFVKILVGLVHHAGLLIFTDDEAKTVDLIRMSEFYKLAPHEDWTNKVDCTNSIKQSVVTDCRNFKIAYAQDSGDKNLAITCSEWDREKFSLLNTNDPDDDCVTEFRNATFAPIDSDGWQLVDEGGTHVVGLTQYGTGFNSYLLQDPLSTNNWLTDEWTQPYTCVMRIDLIIAAGLTYSYHKWSIEVNGKPVAEMPYTGGSFLLSWKGCLYEGDVVKFAITPDPNVTATPDYLEMSAAVDSTVVFSYAYRDFNDVTQNPSNFKCIFLSVQNNRSDADIATLQPSGIISRDMQPRIASYHGLVDATDIGWTDPSGISWRYDDGTGMVPQSQFPYGYFIDYYNLALESLSFSDVTRNTITPDNAGGTVPVTSTGIGEREYKVLLNSLARGVVLRMWVRLTLSDIRDLRFDLPKYLSGLAIGSGLFFLNRVSDWNPQKEIGFCEFIQVGVKQPL